MSDIFIRARSIQRALGNPTDNSPAQELKLGGSREGEPFALIRAEWVREGDAWSTWVQILQLSPDAQVTVVFPQLAA